MEDKDASCEGPPLLPSWRAWYLLVLGALAVVVLLLSALSEVYD